MYLYCWLMNSVDSCPLNEGLYLQTGDLSSLPLLCHYPVKVSLVHYKFLFSFINK